MSQKKDARREGSERHQGGSQGMGVIFGTGERAMSQEVAVSQEVGKGSWSTGTKQSMSWRPPSYNHMEGSWPTN